MVPGSRVMRKISASGAVVALGPDALARGDRRDAGRAEIGPDHAGAGEAEMRRDQQPVDLLVGVVGEREDDPVRPRARLAGLHGDAADDAVASRGRGDADLVAVRAVALDHRGEVDGLRSWGRRARIRRPGRSTARASHSECRQEKGYGERNDPQRFGLSSGTSTSGTGLVPVRRLEGKAELGWLRLVRRTRLLLLPAGNGARLRRD